VTTIAGSGLPGYIDGSGVSASFNSPSGLALDPQGNLYIADQNNFRIRKMFLQ
jgi:DNA-binding beta-propeller fold protein YncE